MDKDGNMIDDDTVVLENAQLKDKEIAERNVEKRNKLKGPMYIFPPFLYKIVTML